MRTVDTLHEYYDLIEVKRVEQIDQLLDLLILLYLDIVLLQAVKGKLALVVNEDLELVAHELAADVLHIWAHSCREHHHLLLGRGGLEDGLHVTSHI